MDNQSVTQMQAPSSRFPTPVLTQPNLPKILLFSTLGLVLMAGSVYVGVQIGKKQAQIDNAERARVVATQAAVIPTLSPTVVVSTNGITPSTTLTKEGFISGKISIDYSDIKEFPDVKDDIVVDILKDTSKEESFGAVLCSTEGDNCVWTVSQKGKTRVYGYKLTMDGNTENILSGSKYELSVSSRIFNTNGNVGDASLSEVVEIPNSGVLIKNFNLVASKLK